MSRIYHWFENECEMAQWYNIYFSCTKYWNNPLNTLQDIASKTSYVEAYIILKYLQSWTGHNFTILSPIWKWTRMAQSVKRMQSVNRDIISDKRQRYVSPTNQKNRFIYFFVNNKELICLPPANSNNTLKKKNSYFKKKQKFLFVLRKKLWHSYFNK